MEGVQRMIVVSSFSVSFFLAVRSFPLSNRSLQSLSFCYFVSISLSFGVVEENVLNGHSITGTVNSGFK